MDWAVRFNSLHLYIYAAPILRKRLHRRCGTGIGNRLLLTSSMIAFRLTAGPLIILRGGLWKARRLSHLIVVEGRANVRST